jgi:hypothetical protein
MKVLIVAVVALLSSSPSWAWEKVVSCDGDMLVVDRNPNDSGSFDYQTVFRGKIVQSMIEQRLVKNADLNSAGEIVRESMENTGILSDEPRAGFELTNFYSEAGNYSVVFSNRYGQAGNYVFESCWFKYPQARR